MPIPTSAPRPQSQLRACVLCGERMPQVNRFGECVECVENAEGSWTAPGFLN
jgi:hypothetical protein